MLLAFLSQHRHESTEREALLVVFHYVNSDVERLCCINDVLRTRTIAVVVHFVDAKHRLSFAVTFFIMFRIALLITFVSTCRKKLLVGFH